MNICNFCKKEFKTISNLNSHLRTSKTCSNEDKKIEYKCTSCDFVSYRNSSWTRHIKNCKNKVLTDMFSDKIKILELENSKLKIENSQISSLHSQISYLQEQNNKLQDDIKFLAEAAIKKTTKIINNNNCNNINNLKPIDQDFIIEQAKNLTIEHIKKGALGYSSYFLEYPLKDSIVCTDFSRKKLKYRDKDGQIVIDPEMSTLSSLLFDSIRQKNKELSIQYINEINEKIGGDQDNMEYWMDIASKFSEQDLEILRMFNGEKNGFFHDILRNICCKTLEK